jgi:hypothetical protein
MLILWGQYDANSLGLGNRNDGHGRHGGHRGRQSLKKSKTFKSAKKKQKLFHRK